MSGDSEIRQEWWSEPLGHLVWLLVTAVCFTLRKRVVGHVEKLFEGQCIVAIWHNRIFTPCFFYRYVIKGRVTMSMLTSASKDGAMLATVAHDYGMRTVRGSSRRRGTEGFIDMIRELEAGVNMCITPDGPKGPIYRCHPGVIKLSSMSGIPVLPVRIHYTSCFRVRSWDRFIIPLPFSRVTLEICEPMSVPPNLTGDDLALYCRRLEDALREDDTVLPLQEKQPDNH